MSVTRPAILLAVTLLLHSLNAISTSAQDRTAALQAFRSLDPCPGSTVPEVLPPDGRPWIVFIFKACCAPSEQAARWIVEAEESYDGRIGIVGLNVDRTRTIGRVRSWLVAHHIEFPVVWDATGQVAQSWGVIAPPSVILLDSSGVEVHRTMGYIPAYDFSLSEKLATLLSDDNSRESAP